MSSPPTITEPPRQADAEEEDSWRLKTPEQKLEYLYRTTRESIRELASATFALKRSVSDTQKSVDRIEGILGNHAQTTGDQLRMVLDRLTRVAESRDASDRDIGKIAAELASIRTEIDHERKERRKADSIHEEEITGVGQKAVHAIERVKETESAISQVKGTLTAANAFKATALAIIVELFSRFFTHVDASKILEKMF